MDQMPLDVISSCVLCVPHVPHLRVGERVPAQLGLHITHRVRQIQ